MPNVKPGDLCLVVGTTVTPGLNGRVVEVVGIAKGYQPFKSVNNDSFTFDPEAAIGNKSWEVKSSDPLPWKLLSGEIKQMQTRPVGDKFLVKIKDGELTLDEETETETEISKNTPLTKEKETT